MMYAYFLAWMCGLFLKQADAEEWPVSGANDAMETHGSISVKWERSEKKIKKVSKKQLHEPNLEGQQPRS